jgi:thiosulfate dehydrogenase
VNSGFYHQLKELTSVKRFILGLIIGLFIPAVIGYCYVRFGFAPIATSAQPMPFEAKAANMIMRSHMQKEMPKNVPMQPTEDNLMQGANIYSSNCSFCHGVPDQPATLAAKGMFPLPPQLFNKDEMVTDDPVGRTYWTVKNGLRMTGMPGFGEMLSENQLWQVSLLLSQADKLPAGTKAALTRPQPTTSSTTPSTTPAVTPKPSTAAHHHHHDHDD